MAPISISVVIPVFRGERTLPSLIDEIEPLTHLQQTPRGRVFRVEEVLLVWDSGPGTSHDTIRALSARHEWVRPIWLSRNFGQHAATLAGMTASGGDWIITMDEDGQHDPSAIALLLDTAFDETAQLVYARAGNAPPHGALRNAGSALAKTLFTKVLTEGTLPSFSSYRLVEGEVGRSLAAYMGAGVYLDVALSWVVGRCAVVSVVMRDEGRPAQNYRLRHLTRHFGRMVISSGTKPLVFVTWMGAAFVAFGALMSAWVLWQRFAGAVPITGWTSMFVALLMIGGAILFSLGIIAQYVGTAANMSLGKPLYLITSDPIRPFERDT